MIDNVPGYKPTEEQKVIYVRIQEAKKRGKWLARQQLKEVENFVEPFEGYFAGIDLWPDGAITVDMITDCKGKLKKNSELK